jgi:hypothetical protein
MKTNLNQTSIIYKGYLKPFEADGKSADQITVSVGFLGLHRQKFKIK